MDYYCKYCKNSDFSDYLVLNSYKYKRCKVCKLVQLVPMPTSDELTKFYNEDYYSKNYDTNSPERESIILAHTQIQYKILKRNFKIERDSKFFDFGCGTGSFLDMLNANKHQLIYGFDFNQISAKILKSKGYGYINILEQNTQTFDIITLWDVAEHLTDPIATFRLLYNKLNINGILVIGTARIDDFVDKTGFGFTMWADPPAHTILYNKKVLIKMLKVSGFENSWIDNKHSISNIYISKYKMLKRLIKKTVFYFRTDRKNKKGDGSYLVVISKK